MELLVLDPDFNDVDIIDSFESLIWTGRYCDSGDFEIYTAINSDTVKYLSMKDFYLWTKDSDKQMIIEDLQIKTDTEEGNKLIITGRSLESILDRRIIWGQSILTGNFQNGIKKLIDENVISPTTTDRKIKNFIFDVSNDPAITSLTIDAQFTGDNLFDAIKQLCSEKHIGFKVTLSDDNLFHFKLYSGVDRSYDQFINPFVVFSPNFENLVNSNYVESKKKFKTVTLVAGEGEGNSRKLLLVEISNGGGSGLSRRELFTDARDVSSSVDGGTLTLEEYNAQISQRGKEKLAENIIVRSFEGQADTSSTYVYGTDFFLGDIVQIANEYDIEARSRVTEFIYSESTSGVEVRPTFEAL